MMRMIALTLALLPAASGCSCSDGHGSCTAGVDCPDADPGDTAAGDAAQDTAQDTANLTLVSIRIVPPNPVVTSVNGAPARVDLNIEATWSDMSTTTVADGRWSLDATRLGDIHPTTGLFIATGDLAGTVTASVGALSMAATTTITVNIEHEVIVGTTPTDAAARFGGTPVDDPARRAGLLYPPQDALMPENVFPVDVQVGRGRFTPASGHIRRQRIPYRTPGRSRRSSWDRSWCSCKHPRIA